MNQYLNYRADELAQDESFQQWVFRTDSDAISFWTNWVALYPERLSEVKQAREIVLTLGLPASSEDNFRLSKMKQAIWSQIAETEVTPRRKNLWQYAIAACVAMLLLGGGIWWLQWPGNVSHTTQYGERKTIVLPDSTLVTLKANSTISYPRKWSNDSDREVWLEGEAFFHVKEIVVTAGEQSDSHYLKFTVHTINQVEVAVLGTEFNISTRRQETEVALKSGSIQLKIKEDDSQTMLLSPGELVSINHDEGLVTTKKVEIAPTKRWQDNMLLLDEITLSEVAVKLQYSFGINILFEDEAIGQYTFKGYLPHNDLEILLEAFAELYNLEIEEREGNQIIFRSQHL
ncbi:MAG: FecR domain-containing protein [Tunicatimonas sp.]|uniref:FecR family protein n=1 Tax=Tunicatimonas sp. TaxID=1940096 RepID=UPI003C7610F4